jgi:hypothetical protein
MADYYYGRMGSLVWMDGSTERTIARVTDWSIETTVDVVEAQAMDMNSKRRFPIANSSTGSCTALYYRGQKENEIFNLLTTAMKTKSDSVSQSDRLTLRLKTDSAISQDVLECKVYVTSASVRCATSEMTTVALSFTVDEMENVFDRSA